MTSLTRAENERRNDVAIRAYDAIAGPGSWQSHEMWVTAFHCGGNAPWDDMTDTAITAWAEDFALIDIELDQEIARERAEAAENE